MAAEEQDNTLANTEEPSTPQANAPSSSTTVKFTAALDRLAPHQQDRVLATVTRSMDADTLVKLSGELRQWVILCFKSLRWIAGGAMAVYLLLHALGLA